MGFFSKRNNENVGFIINTDEKDIKISGEKNLAPHAMTPDEVSNLWVLSDDTSNVTQTGALDSLKKRMNVSTSVPNGEEPEEQKALTFKPDSNEKIENTERINEHEDKSQKTLVEKVKRYTIDEHGKDASENNEPLYRLESVAEILMSNGESAMKSLSEKYGIDINNTNTNCEKQTNPDISEKTDSIIRPTLAFEKMVIDSEKREAQERFDNLFTDNKKQKEIPDVSVPDISDIDNKEVGITTSNDVSNTATIRFTPIKDTKGNTDHITISSSTRHIDLGEDYVEDISSQSTLQNLEQSEFEKFTPKNEITDIASGKKIMRELAIKKRSGFISVFVSALSVIALLVFLLPPVFDIIIAKPKSAMFTCGAFLLVSVMANINMFVDIKNLIKNQCGFDAIAALGAIFSLSLTICAALTHANAYYIILLCAIILLIRSICNFKEISCKISNQTKNALSNFELKN